METLLTTEDYNFAIKKLVKLMNNDTINSNEKLELERLLDSIDHYNGLEYLKVRNN